MKKIVYTIVLLVCIAIFAVSAYQLAAYVMDQRESSVSVKNIKQQLEQQLEQLETASDNHEEISDWLLALCGIHESNSDFIGWIKIDGTVIDYPVMQSSENDPEYYLYRTADGQENNHGSIFVSAYCSIAEPSDNLVIYGHNMKDGSMFAELVNYEDEGYYQEHPVICFDTIYALGEYEIISVFQTQIGTGADNEFNYYDQINFTDQESFFVFYNEIKKLSLYDTGVTAQYGDRFITLSTCEYSSDDGRFVVVARLVNE